MNYRTHHGCTFSEIGIGCYALSGAYGQKDPHSYRQMLQRAIELGVTFFDTANTYGDLAEELLGEVIQPHRSSIFLATKAGMQGNQTPDLSFRGILNACEGSLRRLQTEYIDLYQIHYDDPLTPVEETLEALDELLKAGKIRNYGIGHLPMDRIRTYLETGKIFSGQYEFSAVARDTRKEILPLLLAHKTGMIAFSVTGRGLLANQIGRKPSVESGDIRVIDPLFQRDRYQSALRITNKFIELGQLYGKSSTQTAIAWVLSQPGVICALTGPSSITHLEENLGGSGWMIAKEHLEELEQFYTAEDERLQKELRQSIRGILVNPLSSDSTQAIQDLIYVIETAITCGWIEQEKIMPYFMEVWQEKKAGKQASLQKLESTRHEIANLIDPDILLRQVGSLRI
jgi:aryl-alcohol dehydrogenase-like predicted oxidoreductase